MQRELGFGLPEYTVRKSNRARNPGLRYSARDGLEVVIPRGMRLSSGEIRGMLEQGRAWIERARHRVQERARNSPHRPAHEVELPLQLSLPLCGLSWELEHRAEPGEQVVVEEARAPGPANPGKLVVRGLLSDHALCFDVLRSYLVAEARPELLRRLAAVSREIGLDYTVGRVRSQKTRWGSCSSAGSINLNFKLAFFPPEVVRSVLVHELCHTVHLNHSAAFYKLVARFDPRHKEHDRTLKSAEDFLPAWLLAV